MTDDYIKGYNDALADIKYHTTRWANVRLREHGEPYLNEETSYHINKLCSDLRRTKDGGC